uniref:STAS domain-containing protein n=1 Tax=Ananas comosus var. bracteatus TaxID=296719 RepID=A0A6V7PDA8_ANACO|nr:unnamed protein product [Ananas comosus var. bracteatus]
MFHISNDLLATCPFLVPRPLQIHPFPSPAKFKLLTVETREQMINVVGGGEREIPMEISYATSSNLNIADSDVIKGLARHVRGPARWRSKLRSMSALHVMEFVFPCTRWIRTYQWQEYFQMDLMAGITAMSYAKLAGLHPIYGLYSGFVPIFVYAIFGSSRQLAIGPVTLVSLLVSNVLGNIVDPSDALYTELAILLAFMVGVLECIMGLLRLGWLLRFISHSVISGFVTSSAIVIALSQAKYFLGYNVERSSKIVPLARSIIAGAADVRNSKKSLRFLRASGPLTAVILGTTFVKTFRPSSISVVGEIPQGLPQFHIPRGFEYAQSLLSTAVLITGVAILESVGIAKALAAKNGYDLDSNQELFGLGMANICGSFFSSYPATGSFSRSAVNHETGAKTGLSGVIMGCTMGCALYFLTPLFRDIPQCALAAIVISVGISLVDYEEAAFLWRVDKKDFLLWTITCIITLFLGIEIGVLVGVSASLAFVIHESANPHIAVLGRLPGTTVYRNIEQYPEAYIYYGIVVVRIDAPIYFANISYIKDRLREYELDSTGATKDTQEKERIYFVIIEMAAVPYIDSSAVQALKDLHQEYKSREIQMAFSNPNRKVLITLSRAGLIELIGKRWYFVSAHDAVKACLQYMENFHGSMPGAPPGLVQCRWRQSDGGDESNSDQEPLLSPREV